MDRHVADASFNRFVGTLIAVSFGLVFVLANTDAVTEPWRTLLRVAAVVVAVGLLVGAVLTLRRGASGPPVEGRAWGRGYWVVVGVEVLALVVGLVVINGVLGVPRFAVAWVALVVGVHFVVLATVWRMPMFRVLGLVMTGCGLLGFVLGAATSSVAAVQLVSGVCSGAALFVAAGSAVPVRRGTPR